ncbi:atrial natriuretic peptide-converting enzyme-like isoform X2 [Chelonus insularis]|uniref:atrial natriuretic peptide-converting enzyme-like isoform X2 n=1 Tax=Chelonus insularis TaxID=460826 RepID=UPI00158AF8F8|nr:atrial natriuretic peptide-converting enzyme-like isoform X2 [Chelonus insularis]
MYVVQSNDAGKVIWMNNRNVVFKVNEMSRVEGREDDLNSICQPRQIRTNSVALPACGSMLLVNGNQRQPPLPRRHSETPARAPPPIPIRKRNEKPIFLTGDYCRRDERKLSLDDNIKNQSSESNQTIWRQEINDNEKLIDLESTRSIECNFKASKNLVENADGCDFDVSNYGENGGDFGKTTEGSFKSSFEELQKAARNFDKRLQEEIIRGVEIGRVVGSQEGQRQRDRFNPQSRLQAKFEHDQEAHHDAEKRSKFKALLAASRNLEKHLQGERELQQQTRGKYNLDMEKARNMLQNNLRKDRVVVERLEKLPKATQTNLPPPLSSICQNPVSNKPASVRQDSNVSSDSFSQTSSPSYTSKTMEAPLLPHKHIFSKIPGKISEKENSPGSPITKSMSTPASLQTIVRFHSGSNMSLHHRIIRDMRRPSGHYVFGERFRFRFVQVLVNALALLAITAGFLFYFKTNPEIANVKSNNLTTEKPIAVTVPWSPYLSESKNPAPGVCLPVIVSFCLTHQVPYNFTVFPNYMGNFRQRDAQHELENYEAVVDVRCYELAALFLCNVFVPKCGSRGQVVHPCRSLCYEMTRRCGFFLTVFSLKLPDFLSCENFPETADSDVCVGHHEVIEAANRAANPVCISGFQCDSTRCIPVDWKCDGHVDCADQTDEIGCGDCALTSTSQLSSINAKSKNLSIQDVIDKPTLHCGERRCMSTIHVCDGVMDCPWGQDERNCLRLSESNGDIGKGRLQVFNSQNSTYIPACISYWKPTLSQAICNLLGYSTVDFSVLLMKNDNSTLSEPFMDTSQRWRLAQKSEKNLLKELQSCTHEDDYATIELKCSEFECGRRRYHYGNAKVQKRIIGGVESVPGDWPFLAALLGGPEEVFYCAGVLISDQWVLTASHCVGNYSILSDWTIQLGITRRHSHSYFGEKLKVKRVIPHPSYNLGVVHDNDVALFQLKERVNFHEHLRPVCLPKASMELAPGTICTVIGWGKKEDTDASKYEPAVNEVEVPVLKRELCNAWLEHKELNVTDGMICAGYPEGKKDACQGDSGGPLLCRDENDKDRWFVGGIVSWGIKCAHPKLPGVYAYVPKYVPWIYAQMSKYSDSRTD